MRRVVAPVIVHQPAHPRDFVRIEEGTPYVVPVGRILVVTALGAKGSHGTIEFRVNGVFEVVVKGSGGEWAPTVAELPTPGVAAAAGDSVEVDASGVGSDGRAWGYLVDA